MEVERLSYSIKEKTDSLEHVASFESNRCSTNQEHPPYCFFKPESSLSCSQDNELNESSSYPDIPYLRSVLRSTKYYYHFKSKIVSWEGKGVRLEVMRR